MKKTAITTVFAFLFLLFSNVSNAQNYKSAIGIRAGWPFSGSFKTFVTGNNAVELYGGWRGWTGYHFFSAHGAYLLHYDLEGLDGLQWYAGGGAGAYFWSFDDGYNNGNAANTSFSLQGYLGLDFTLKDAPVNFTLDWVPTIFLNGYSNGFAVGYGNFGVRYILSR